MMLEWLGETHNDPAAVAAGQQVERAVAKVLAQGTTLTADLGGRSGTKEVGKAVIAALSR